MTTDTPARDELKDFPCPIGPGMWCNAECAEALDRCKDVTCRWLPVYRAHIALRADMRKLRAAVLGDMTPAVAREIYSATAGLCKGMALYNAAGRLHALADVVAKL